MHIAEYFKIAILSGVTALSIGCETRSGADASSAPADTSRFRINGAERTFVSAEPAVLKATFGATPILELSFQGAAEGRVWSSTARLTMAQVERGEIAVSLSDGPIADGVANLALQDSGKSPQIAATGSLRASISNGKIVGKAVPTPASLAGNFDGEISIECWVPRSSIRDGAINGGTTDSSGAEALVEDTELRSSLCAPLKALRAKSD